MPQNAVSRHRDIVTGLIEKGYVEIDLDMLAFLERYATSMIKLDIISFFARNPNTRDYGRNLAGRLGRSVAPMLRELDDLALVGFLTWEKVGHEVVYALTEEQSVRQVLSRFAARFG